MISHQHKCIFIHIPRTGGTSLERIIWPGPRDPAMLWMGFTGEFQNKYQTGGLQHLLARHVKQEFGQEVFDSYFKFALVRNPWDRLVSQYFYLRSRENLMRFLGYAPRQSFKSYLQFIGRNAYVQWEQQHKFLYSDDGELMVEFVGRFENYRADVQHILDRLGIAAELPHAQQTSHDHYTSYYDAEAIEMVAAMYEKDIRLFGYTFDGS